MNFWILYQFCMKSLLGNLGFRFFPFSLLNMSFHSLLACRISAERLAVKYMEFPLFVTCCFSLAAFNILSLGLIFFSLISVCLMFLLGFILCGIHCASWTSSSISFPIWGKFPTMICSKFFLYLFFFSSFSSSLQFECWSPRGLWDYPQFFAFFLLYSSLQQLFSPIFQLTYPFSCLRYSAINSF